MSFPVQVEEAEEKLLQLEDDLAHAGAEATAQRLEAARAALADDNAALLAVRTAAALHAQRARQQSAAAAELHRKLWSEQVPAAACAGVDLAYNQGVWSWQRSLSLRHMQPAHADHGNGLVFPTLEELLPKIGYQQVSSFTGCNAASFQFHLTGAGQEHLQALERALGHDAKEESALHKRATAVQKAADEVAVLAPDAARHCACAVRR